MEFDDLDPGRPGYHGYEFIRVMVTNHAGVKELTRMPRAHWSYLAWLEDEGHMNVDEFIRYNSQRFSDVGIGKIMIHAVAELAYNRDRKGLPAPAWFAPVESLGKDWYEGIKGRMAPMF